MPPVETQGSMKQFCTAVVVLFLAGCSGSISGSADFSADGHARVGNSDDASGAAGNGSRGTSSLGSEPSGTAHTSGSKSSGSSSPSSSPSNGGNSGGSGSGGSS